MTRRETGSLGERLACDFLAKNGYKILERNYRCTEGEIDIIAKHDKVLVFVEVRTKKSSIFGFPEESIDTAKKRKLCDLVALYCQSHEDLAEQWRIDVVAVEMNKENNVTCIKIIENAVEDSA
jgi:putative endonuclease